MRSPRIDRAPNVSSKDKEARARKLGALIRQTRERRALSQRKLAEDLGVSLSTLRKVEQGQIPTPGFWLVAQIAARLDLGLEELMRGERKRPTSPPAFQEPQTPRTPTTGAFVTFTGREPRIRPGDRIRVEGPVVRKGASHHVKPVTVEVERRTE
jgi:transcriptional regulator with XRE-family HTH domain